MVNVIKKSQIPILAAALIALGSIDYFAAKSLAGSESQNSPKSQQVHQQQLDSMKAHIQLCSLTETIMSLAYDSGVAMAGYSITKDKMFSERFDKIADVLPKKVEQLKQLVSDNSEEEHSADTILKLSNAILQVNGETKKLIDDPATDVDQLRNRHVYKVTRANAEDLKNEIQSLRDKDLARTENSVPIVASETKESSSFQIFLLAMFNAISGCVILWLLARCQKSG